MYGVCLRYASSEAEASDMLQEGFIKVFAKLDQYQGSGVLPAWIKKVVIRSALEYLRKQKKHRTNHYDLSVVIDSIHFDFESVLNTKELLVMIQELPVEYRSVFNLFSIEGYAHKEIAEMLEISVSNSKVRLMRAKELLQQKVKNQKTA